MRVAIQIGGQPRFTKDLTDFIQNLQGDYQADWFFYLWQNNPLPDKGDRPTTKFIHDSWRTVDYNKAKQCIEKNLPGHHRLVKLVVRPREDLSIPDFKDLKNVSSVHNVWNMWHGWKLVNGLRLEHQQSKGPYDLVVKMRGDCGLTQPLDVASINRQGLTVSCERWHGYGKRINDLFGFGDCKTITEYCNVIDCAAEYNKDMPFHAETLLAHHLEKRNIPVHAGQWGLKFRTQTAQGECDWGNWICL